VLTLCIDWISGIIWIHLIPIPAWIMINSNT
jgi:hypothetical protein